MEIIKLKQRFERSLCRGAIRHVSCLFEEPSIAMGLIGDIPRPLAHVPLDKIINPTCITRSNVKCLACHTVDD